MSQKEWFSTWFDTEYYHTLYKHRNDEEAELFISNLLEHLALPKDSKLLDLACGKGRHSITMNKLGYNVLGVDLSDNSISFAKQFENESLKFAVQDMREIIPNVQFDGIFNLFTSFGYFDAIEDNVKVLKAVHHMLKHRGLLVIDFMNATKVIRHLVKEEEKTIDGIEFSIRREVNENHIFKHISINDNGSSSHYSERVQAISLTDFDELLSLTGFDLISTFGDFNLNPFNEGNSDRLIIVAQKK